MQHVQISKKVHLGSAQLRTVADRRFGDAQALLDTRKNVRANGAIYLAGFAVECLLKAMLLEKFPWLENAGSPAGRSKEDSNLWFLCYSKHDLVELSARLPVIEKRLGELEKRESNRLIQSFRQICAEWTIHIRYSPQSVDLSEAEEFLGRIKELKPCLARS